MPRLGRFAVCTVIVATGCIDSGKTVQDAREQNNLERKVADLERELQARDQTLRDQRRQIQTLQGIDGDGERLKLIPHADRIEIDPLSGGYGGDARSGSEGLVVYLQTFDQDGDPIKAAGSVDLEVLDLNAPPDRQLIAECKYDPAALRQTWYSKFLTSHYTLKCPWKSGPPPRATLTLRARFVDLVTGKTFELVKQVKVNLPLGASGA